MAKKISADAEREAQAELDRIHCTLHANQLELAGVFLSIGEAIARQRKQIDDLEDELKEFRRKYGSFYELEG